MESLDEGGAADWNRFRSTLKDIDLTQADLSNCALAEYNLARANLSAAKLFNADLSGADLTRASLTYADMRRANLATAYLTGANLSGANLQGANLVDADLSEATLRGAMMAGAHIVGANLVNADLQEANLRCANMKFANVKGAKMKGADVDETNLSGVELDEEAIKGLVNFDSAVIQSRSVVRVEHGKRRRLAPEEDYEELFKEEDSYKILGIARGAVLEDVVKAYRKRAKEYHPDRVAHLGEKLQYVAQREFTRVQTAYRSIMAGLLDPMMSIAARSGSAMADKDARELTIEDYIELLKWQPNNEVLHYNLGVRYMEMGLVELASKAYTKALELNPKNEHARHNLKLAKLLLMLQS